MFHVDDLHEESHLFKDMASSFKIEQYFNDIENHNGQSARSYITAMKLICTDIGNTLEELYNFYSSHLNTNTVNNSIFNRNSIRLEVIEIAEKYNLYNPATELLFDKLTNWFKDIEIIRYVNINEKTLPYVLKTLYEKKKRLNVEYYQKIVYKNKNAQLAFNFDKVEDNNPTKFKFITQNVIS